MTAIPESCARAGVTSPRCGRTPTRGAAHRPVPPVDVPEVDPVPVEPPVSEPVLPVVPGELLESVEPEPEGEVVDPGVSPDVEDPALDEPTSELLPVEDGDEPLIEPLRP